MRWLAVVVGVAVVALPVLANVDVLSIAAELGAGSAAVGLYSCFVAGVFSDVVEACASLQGVALSDVPLPDLTVLIAGGTALLAAPLVAASAVTATGKTFGAAVGSAYAFSTIFAYAGGAWVFEREWTGQSSHPEWLPEGVPEWVATLTVVTTILAVVGFHVGVIVSGPSR